MHTHNIRREREMNIFEPSERETKRVRKRSETRIMMKLYSTETETNFTQFIFLIFHNIFGLILSLRKSVMWLHTDATCHIDETNVSFISKLLLKNLVKNIKTNENFVNDVYTAPSAMRRACINCVDCV